ncbi:uncharacterized protein (DUF305 family) [Asanoa ferruginea]|uniref:Uncharacterized protein (DUF305 family) n=1 Tax=Asanoa ferruginea TaxID=53367 RepID=A0A3D9ZK01_9ACTN|nr:DUF305 domain-containing protein [Asanoa ferruginea]REF97531.1 uncharacterized protein (DUF305 family) [Asanoa ferruginea]GIF48180.1 DUF305 domain-containing protein [Asanoa ferruginea]
MSTTYDDPVVNGVESDPVVPRGRRPLTIAAAVVAAVLVLIAVFGAGWFAHSRSHPGDDSVEAGFARDMSTHHAQAVEMSMLALNKSTQPDLRLLAGEIVQAQQAQIGMMQTWLREWNLEPTGHKPPMSWMKDGASLMKNGLMPGMASAEDMTRLRNATGADFDQLFLHLMQQHHLGGIHMVDGILAVSHEGDVTWLAQAMANNQRAELEFIQQILTKIGA